MKKFLKSFVYSFQGIAYAFTTQLSFRVHCLATLLVICLGIYTNLTAQEWLWITAAIAIVVILELVNTSIEILVDLVSPGQNPKAGAIKDVASAAVLVGGLMALIIGLIIFVPKLI